MDEYPQLLTKKYNCDTLSLYYFHTGTHPPVAVVNQWGAIENRHLPSTFFFGGHRRKRVTELKL